jgi:hypothetical protein
VKKILTYRPSASMLVAILAVVLACGGSATAARLITGKQIKNNSVTSSDVRNNSLRSKDVRNRSLLAKDFKRGQLPRGAQGPQGLRGSTGATGPRGPAGFGVLEYPFDFVQNVPTGTQDLLLAQCPAGTFPTGGDAGANASAVPNGDEPSVITQQAIAFDAAGPFGYYADYDNETGHDVDVFVDAACANASSIAFVAGNRFRVHKRTHRK